MPRLPREVWPLHRILDALREEDPQRDAVELESRARRIYHFMWRDADRWYSSGGRQLRLKRLFNEARSRVGGRVGVR